MTGRLLAAFLLAALSTLPAAAAPADALLKELKAGWSKLDRMGKLDGLLRLGAHPSRPVLAACRAWLKDDDPVVRGHVARLVAAHAADPALKAEARSLLAGAVERALKERRKREDREFDAVCREHGRTPPPHGEMTAGADWQDPWDEKLREPPRETLEERAQAKELVAALESARDPALHEALHRILAEHHDPEVVLRAIEALGALGEWRALPSLADLGRVQSFGRDITHDVTLDEARYDVLRLKWDVHKDRLWWSRPEYMPRVRRPVLDAAGAITGERFASISDLDAWLLANGAKLKEHGVQLSASFKERAKVSQR